MTSLIRGANRDVYREPAFLALKFRDLPAILKAGGLRCFIEVATDSSEDARRDDHSIQVDSEFQDGDAAR
jgi:hypothetical protein